MMSQSGTQVIAILILPNFLRRKGNRTVKLGLLIKYNMRNIFLKDVVGKLVPDPFIKNKK